jgi:4-hydroxyacetophenone monooxygenase
LCETREVDVEAFRSAAEDAIVAALLPAVALLTGDVGVLRDDLRPDATNLFDPQGGLSPERLAQARAAALSSVAAWCDRGSPAPPSPTDAELERVMAYVVGADNAAEYFEFLREELALGGEDLRAPGWHKDDYAADVPFSVAIVGAGMSGILAAYRLKQAGVPFVVFEKNGDVGGTWWENVYPGCRVDVPNHLYSYSFAQTAWSEHFSAQPVLLEYFRGCVDRFGLRDHIRFSTEVESASFSEEACAWTVQLSSGEAMEFQALISAVGQLNRPKMPAIAGLDDFAGPAFHSARWDPTVELRDQRVAVIGTGASAAQLIPIVADEARQLTVFQRTPNWLVPTPDYHDDVSPGVAWLQGHLPGYSSWYRMWLFWRTHEGLLPAAKVDPEWPHQEQSVSAPNEFVRLMLAAYLEAEFAGRPDLLAQVVPTYPPIAKRIIRDNGVWAKTLTRPNVSLITESIERITPRGVRTADGVEHEADVLIYGTGFQASEFLTPMRITGRGGVELHDRWKGDARAYLGITVPGFPNLFCLYGPNTNIVINGSIIFFSECEVRYVVESLRLLLKGGHRGLDCRGDVHDAFNRRVDEANRQMAWGASSVNSWYKNSTGRVAQNWPFSLLEYWQETQAPDPTDYELL